jgi:hypothetical protein
MVSGLTKTRAERQFGQRRKSHVQRKRSAARRRTRPCCDRRSTLSWWRSATISNCSAVRVRKEEQAALYTEAHRENMGREA